MGFPFLELKRGQTPKGLSLRLALAGTGKDLSQGVFAVEGKAVSRADFGVIAFENSRRADTDARLALFKGNKKPGLQKYRRLAAPGRLRRVTVGPILGGPPLCLLLCVGSKKSVLTVISEDLQCKVLDEVLNKMRIFCVLVLTKMSR